MPRKTTVKTKKNSKSSKKPKIVSKPAPKATNFSNFFYGTVALVATYVVGLWAIDSGSLWVYALTFTALYYTIHFYRLFIRNKFFNNDKPTKARTAKV